MKNRLVFVIVLIISIVITFYSIFEIKSLSTSKNRLYEAQEHLDGLKKESAELKKELEYRETDEFIISEARDKLNYSFPDEEIYIVPKERNIDIAVSEVHNSAEKITQTYSAKAPLFMWFDVFFAGARGEN